MRTSKFPGVKKHQQRNQHNILIITNQNKTQENGKTGHHSNKKEKAALTFSLTFEN